MRFKFGKNWKNYLKTLTDEKINSAIDRLQSTIKKDNLKGLSFIDIGSGSGVMSLAAVKMGAKVLSFDYDKDSVDATRFVKESYEPENDSWQIEQGSALDEKYLKEKGIFDVVYSWGVLHHTGKMWLALDNVSNMVNDNGFLFIAIYNDQGGISKFWKTVKKIYNSNVGGKLLICGIFLPYFYLIRFFIDLIKHLNPFYTINNYSKSRGMNFYHDVIDWIGGYPFEVATPGAIFDFFKKKGFSLINLKSTTSLGCNEFVFIKDK